VSDVVTGRVEAVAPGGRGLVREQGGVIFARGGLPGDVVEIRVTRAQRGVRHGEVLRVLEPSPDRVVPDCPLHGVASGTCGGCDLLSLSVDAARRAREHIVDDVLRRVARFEPDVIARVRAPLVSAGPTDDARRRRARLTMHGGRPTFSSAESHDRVVVERCPALHPVLEAAVRRLASARLGDGVSVRVACDDRGHVSVALDGARPGDAARIVEAGVAHGALRLEDDDVRERAGDPVLLGEIAPGFLAGDAPCRSDASVFSQATRFGARAILDEVLRGAAVAPGDDVVELFAGSGHLTVPLLSRGARVHAVEGAGRGVEFLVENTRPFADRCSTKRAYIDGSLPLPPARVLVADPPRTGIPELAGLLARARGVERLVLVSCDPATGARDLALAVKTGFALERVVPIDAFPRTSHVEWVATLRARGQED
jgi:tRNA/tmRNA/rRNA uracil-C5-methylase (TrmA/RlmC/RlmD family)